MLAAIPPHVPTESSSASGCSFKRGSAFLSILHVSPLPTPAFPGPHAKPGCCWSHLGHELLCTGCSWLPWDSCELPPRSTGCCTHGQGPPKPSRQSPASWDMPTERVVSERLWRAGSEPEGRSAAEPPSHPRPLKDFFRIYCRISWIGDFCPAAGDSGAKRPQCATRPCCQISEDSSGIHCIQACTEPTKPWCLSWATNISPKTETKPSV